MLDTGFSARFDSMFPQQLRPDRLQKKEAKAMAKSAAAFGFVGSLISKKKTNFRNNC